MEPAKVAASPNAISTVSWISPAGSMYSPQKRSTRPPREIMAAISNCINLSFIGCFKNKTKGRNTFWLFFKSGAKVQQKNEATKLWGSA